MSTAIGVSLPRLATAVGKAVSEYAVLGKTPGFTADFIKNKYPSYSSFASAITHSRSGNAVMTDGYGDELVTNGSFTTDVSSWSIQGTGVTASSLNGVATVVTNSSGQGIYQNITTEAGKTYIINWSLVDTSLSSANVTVRAYPSGDFSGSFESTEATNGYLSFTATGTDSRVYLRTNGADVTKWDNVSVREMPVLKWAPHNLLNYSEDLTNVAWNKNSFTVVADDTTAPDGTETADKITTAGVSGSIQNTTALSASVSHTIVCYAKYIDNPWIRIARESSAVNAAWFNIQTGVAGSVTDAADSSSITDVGNGWYRLELVMAAPTSSSQINFVSLSSADNSTSMASGKSAHVWGAHLYRSDLGGMVDNPDRGDSYVPTTSAAVYLPRVGHHVYNSSAWVNEGLLAESEARTNLWLYSNDPTNAAWNGYDDVTRPSSASSTGPDGQTSGYSLIPTAVSSNHYVAQSFSLTSGNDYTFSFYLKENGYRYAQIIIGGAYSADDYANFDLQDGVIGNTSTAATATIQDVGNGWFRCSCTFPADATATGNSGIGFIQSLTDGRVPSFLADGTSGIDVYGAQFEAASTPSSFIPTSGSSVTRAAETFTIPSANLPWPSPQYIGSELVTNGTFDTDVSGWADDSSTGGSVVWNSSGYLELVNATGAARARQDVTVVSGKIYEISFSVTTESSGNVSLYVGSTSAGGELISGNQYTTGTHSVAVLTTNTLLSISFRNFGTGLTHSLDNVSVREINPLSVSIAMDGRMTYADEGSLNVFFFRWYDTGTDYLQHRLDTRSSDTGQVQAVQVASGTADTDSSDTDTYSPDVLVPYSIAARHGSTFVELAADGNAFIANTTPIELPDLSSTDLDLAYTYMGTIGTFRVWDRDITDAGLVEATNPSLEPSLSLTFEGTGTNSFVVNDWSE